MDVELVAIGQLVDDQTHRRTGTLGYAVINDDVIKHWVLAVCGPLFP